jgi:DNA-directed RNA polymerase specialized sigma24 family protein
MTDLAASGVGPSAEGTRRLLARHVYRHSTELMGETARTTDLTPTMARLAHFARLQRASLALCAFGGHTYQEAAELLGVASLTVAELLTSGLDELRGRYTPGTAIGA